MPINALNTIDVIEVMENFIEKRRPPVELRPKVDLAYRIENQSIYIFEIRPRWDNPREFFSRDIAKATYTKTSNLWKIYWQLSSSKWISYKPAPWVKTFKEFTDIVSQDRNGCFWG